MSIASRAREHERKPATIKGELFWSKLDGLLRAIQPSSTACPPGAKLLAHPSGRRGEYVIVEGRVQHHTIFRAYYKAKAAGKKVATTIKGAAI